MIGGLKNFAKSLIRQTHLAMGETRHDLPFDHWNITRKASDMHLYDINLTKLLELYGSPLHVLDEGRLRDNVRESQIAACGHSWPIELFFSYKTTPVPGILEMIHDEAAGSEVISAYELWLAFEQGLEPSRIIYNGPAKSNASLEQAIRRGILSININHTEEIYRIRDATKRVGKRASVSFRIVFPGYWSGQFGIATAGEEALDAYRIALAMPELDVIGVHCHRGHIFSSAIEWEQHIDQILDFCALLENKLGFIPRLLDFGGGLPIPTTRFYTPMEERKALFGIEPLPPIPQKIPPLKYFCQSLSDRIRAFYTQRQWPQPKIAIEPGRAITGNAQMLLTRVTTTKKGRLPYTYAVLDAGINIASIVRREFHQVFPLIKTTHNPKPEVLYRLVGPICHLGDVLYHAWRLPQLEAGDALAIMDSGAYFIADGNSFSFPQPGIIAINRYGGVREIRRSETYTDLVALDAKAT